MQLLQASALTLHEVKQKFNLTEVRDPDFFPEWRQDLPEIIAMERQWLDSVREDFLDLSEYPLHEEIVKMVVLSPLLSLAGFYRKPFRPVAEKSIEIELEDTDEIVRGRIDVLVLQDILWIVAVESKRWLIGAEKGLLQLLTYMMTGPEQQSPLFGMVTDGQHFEFVKLQRSENSQYAISDEFSLRRQNNELYEVLAFLKKLRYLNSVNELI